MQQQNNRIQVITATEPFNPCLRVFLAGGITNCPDWQSDLINHLRDSYFLKDRLVLFNPRRASFDITNPLESSIQIEWEHNMLLAADAVLFWFPAETLCPITLYELGKLAATKKPLMVGCAEGYQRAYDVSKQLQLVRPEVHVRGDLKRVAGDVLAWALKSEISKRLEYKGGVQGSPHESRTEGSQDRAMPQA